MKIYDIKVELDARNDLYVGAEFYDEQEKGIGDYFWDSLLSDIESLLIYGGVHEKHHGFYRAPAKRFPFFIYYFIEDNIAYAVAVLPMKERPSLIETTLTDRSS